MMMHVIFCLGLKVIAILDCLHISTFNLCSSIPKDLPEDKYHLMTHALKSMEKNVVNYEMYTNKDGRLDWRPLELINPVAYVYLVNLITEENAWSIILKRFE